MILEIEKLWADRENCKLTYNNSRAATNGRTEFVASNLYRDLNVLNQPEPTHEAMT